LEAVKNEDVAIWDLDSEAVVLAPVIIVLTFALFAFPGRWAWRDTTGANRPAKVVAVAGPLGLVGVLAFFLSARSSWAALRSPWGWREDVAHPSKRGERVH
jgi:hypothetical protein